MTKRMIAFFGISLVAIYILNNIVPSSFMTPEDQGYFTVALDLPEGSTIERTRKVTDRAMAELLEDDDVLHVLNVTGSSPRIGTNQAHSTLTVILKPWEKRKTHDIAEIRKRILERLSRYPESSAYIMSPPIIPGLGTSGGFEMVLEARGEATYNDLRNAVDTLMTYASDMPEFEGLSSSLQAEIPQLF